MSTTLRARWHRMPRPLQGTLETVILIVVAISLALLIKTFFAQAFYIPSQSMEPGLQGGPGVQVSDRILVEKPSYWFSSPTRGDIIVFADPGNWLTGEEATAPLHGIAAMMAKVGLYPTGGHLVKRVIGVAGDRIVCCNIKGQLTVNGIAIDESSFIAKGAACDGPEQQNSTPAHGDQPAFHTAGGCTGWTAVVPPGRLFVMGDNRADSADSSYHLCTPAGQKLAETDPAAAATCAAAYVPLDDVVGRVVALLWPANRFTLLHRPAVFGTIK